MEDLSKPALDNVMNDSIQLHPAKFKNTYRNWMENVRDWCISRQLWWGQQIPAFYLKDGTLIVAKDKKEALKKAKEEYQLFALVEEDLTQDPDVLDTWFSSWLWPISVFDGIENPKNEEISYYYPTNDLVTGPDILFFWVARMIIAGYEWRGELPFKNVYLTGIVRDNKGRKMSKSLGNSPDPLELIKQFGADGVRSGLMFSAPAGNDLLFDEKLCEQGRNFSNKIWNAFRLIKGWEISNENISSTDKLAIQWMESKIDSTLEEMDDLFSKFRISDALLNIYQLIWDDFCSKYLEIIKPAYQQPISKDVLEATNKIMDRLMCILHPFMPFITEEIWQNLEERSINESICIQEYPKAGKTDKALIQQFDEMFEVISKIREIRNSNQLSPKTELELMIETESPQAFQSVQNIIQKLANLSKIEFINEKVDGAQTFVVKNHTFHIPLKLEIDPEEAYENAKKEITYLEGFKKSVLGKLSNEKFVQNAKPELVEREKQKLADTESKLNALYKVLESYK
jgi:valyl-tRNA synthetase